MIRRTKTYHRHRSRPGLLRAVLMLLLPVLPLQAVELAWEQCKLSDTAQEGLIWTFDGAWHEDSLALACYTESLYPQASYDGIGIQFPVFEEIKGAALKTMRPMLEKSPVGEEITLQVRQGYQRKKLCWDVSFYPFIRRGNRYFRLLSFEWAWTGGTSLVLAEHTAANYTARQAVAGNAAGRYAAHSRLKEGKWIKISVGETDVYKITYNELRKQGIDPQKAQIYGYGGHLLPEDFSQPYVDDLPPVPVFRNQEEEYLLFYALGPCRWYYDNSRSLFMREQNHYSQRGYYFIGERAEGSLEMETAEVLDAPTRQTRHYTGLVLHEKEFYNLGATGRECYGEDFSSMNDQHFFFDMTDVVADQSSRIAVEFVARSNAVTSCAMTLDGEHKGQMTFPAISADNSYTYGYNRSITLDFQPGQSSLDIGLKYNGSGSVKAAHLDYIILNLRKNLRLNGPSLCFRDPASVGGGQVEYQLGGADAQTLVMDVTRPDSPLIMPSRLDGEGNCLFIASADELKEFVAVNLGGDIKHPTIEGRIDNQDLHALPQADYVIITHPDFLSLANELAEAHSRQDSLRCVVVAAPQVYHEFSSGTPDATAYRRFMKMFYDRAEKEEDLPQSLLLFGDGVYDNRLVTKNFSGSHTRPDKLLTYQSTVTLEGTASYVTDDYFGFLDDTEGRDLSSDKLDIGVGRFPVRTVVEARTAVDKTLNYMQNKDKGVWKNTLLFLGDDGDDNLHTEHADHLAETVKLQHPEFMVNKIYVDAFQRVTTASGTKVPDANQRFAQLLNSGLLLLNYSGHGSTTAWAVESLLSIKDIKSMKNTRLPLWVTATCDFCRYDDYETSGGEYVFLNENGGAVGLVTTSRVVYSGPNFTLNKAFIENIFNKEDGRRLSLGQVMCRTKQSSALSNDRNKLNFTLIGDPALRLAYPEYGIRILSVNGKHIDPLHPDTLKALSTTVMEGEILRTDLSLAEDFNGVLSATVFDAEQNTQTLGNNGNDVFSYKERNKALYSGKSSVRNGRFRLSFIVPKDLSYSFEPGQVNLYAYSLDGRHEAQGVFEDFLLGGTDATAPKDTVGPEIRLFMNDTLFVDGGSTHTNPTLIALLYDENGLNTSGNSIGHDLILTLDGESKINLNNYYASELDSHVRGRIYYNLTDLSEGWHELSLRAWDMQNNSSLASLRFKVSAKVQPKIMDIVFSQTSQAASFSFTHDCPAMWMTSELRVYDLLGRLVWQSSAQSLNPDNQGETIQWNYQDSESRRVGEGVYICRLYISVGDRQEAVMAKKIMIGPQ